MQNVFALVKNRKETTSALLRTLEKLACLTTLEHTENDDKGVFSAIGQVAMDSPLVLSAQSIIGAT